jgi:hypothetical protein
VNLKQLPNDKAGPAPAWTQEFLSSTSGVRSSRAVDELVERASVGLLRRARGACFLGAFLRGGAVALFAAGALMLLSRSIWSLSTFQALWFLLLVPLAAVVAWRRAASFPLTAKSAAAWLDVRAGGSGLLVTGSEQPDARWEEHMRETIIGAPPVPRLSLGRSPNAFLAGLVFAPLALLVPVPAATSEGPAAGALDRSVEELAQELETLKEELGLDEELAQELEERLDALRESVASDNPEGAFEARDRFEDRLEREAEQALDQALGAQEVIERAQAEAAGGNQEEAQGLFAQAFMDLGKAGLTRLAASALQGAMETAMEALDGMSSEEMRALAETIAGLQNSDLMNSLSSEFIESMAEQLALNPELSAALGESLQGLMKDKLGSLRDAGLLSEGALLSRDQLRSLAELTQDLSVHVHDEDCPPGGT